MTPAQLVAAGLLALATVPGGARDAATRPDPRVRVTLNDGWRFAPADLAGAAQPDHADADWQRVALPHTWNVDEGIEATLAYRRGVGWYRRRLTPDPALRGRRLFLHFEGANQVADVFVNGRAAGRHVGGYTAFTFDVTHLVRFDAPNVIAVRVDNRHDPDIPPLNADFTFYGGIYRDVWLIAAAPLHIDLLDHGSSGIFVDVPALSAAAARVRVRGAIVNAADGARSVRVRSRVLDPDGTEALRLEARVDVPAGGRAPFALASAPLAAPRLWSPASPAVYTVRTEVVDDSVIDAVDVPLGFRWFAVDAERGFSLNGAPHQLAGTNRHQDRAGLGSALTDAQHDADLALIRADGFDFLRLAHYPQDPAVLAAADRLGLIVWEEIPVVNEITMSRAFADHAERMLVEMIRQHYNHPSIVFWGYMNEVMLREPRPLPPEYRPAIVALARRLEARVEAEDPGRITATAISFDEVDNGSGFQDVPDVLGLNLYFGWYYRDLAGLGAWLDSLHARHPDRPLLISEYGAGSDERVHTRTGRAFDFSSEYQRRFHEETFPQLRARPWLVGSAVWNHFDFGSAHRQDTKPAVNQKGLRFFDRAPKDVVHYYRALLAGEPVVHVATTEQTARAGSRPEDARQPIDVYTSLERVELLHDGRSLGTRAPVGAPATWDVTLHPGANRLEARGVGAADGIAHTAVVTYQDRTGLFGRRSALAAPVASAAAGAAIAGAGVIAINAGGHYAVVDDTGLVWEPDREWEAGSWGYVGGDTVRTHHRIGDTTLEPLYQVAREGMGAYRFDVADGTYDVTLLFAEVRPRPDGPRAFTVDVNGTPLAEPLDLAVDPVTAVRRTIRTRADRDGIVIRFHPLRGTPAIAGVLIRRL